MTRTIEYGIQKRDRNTIKEGIDTLHDVIKYAIKHNEKVLKNLELGRFRSGKAMSGGSNWFLRKALNEMANSYKLLLETNQQNFAQYTLKAFNSCAIESLKYKKTSLGCSTEDKDLVLYSLDASNSVKSLDRSFRHFVESAFRLDKRDFDLLLRHTFQEGRFLEDVLTTDPYKLYIISAFMNCKTHD